MKRMYEFECPQCSTISEDFVDESVHNSYCPVCGEETKRIISAVRSSLDGTDPGFPDAYDKWARQHEQAGKKHYQ